MNYFFKTKVENHDEIKEKLLEQFNLIPNNPFSNHHQDILHTDWNMPPNMHREYHGLFFKTVQGHVEEVTKRLNCTKYKIDNYWFQQYINSGYHHWHTHGHAHFTNVYFIECPQGYGTQFIDNQYECEEGDIISFPAFIPHSSPPIKNENERKTIISFNTNFFIIDD